MKFETSDKTSSYGVKPYIKKGYYPGKLLQVTEFTEKDGTPKVGKYGQQLIFEFAVYKADENGTPIKPMMFKPDVNKTEEYPVKLSKFVYHKYKKTDKDDKWIDGEFTTAITPNSAVTKLLKALGWTFSGNGVEMEEFIGKWAELNLDDYIVGEGPDAYKASTIQNVNPYEGNEVGELQIVTATEPPKSVKKTLINTGTERVKSLPAEIEAGIEVAIKKREDNITNMKTLLNDGSLSEDGFKQAVTQLESEIKGLRST